MNERTMLFGDWHTRRGAHGLADRIRRYWAAKGFAVEVWLVSGTVDDHGTMFMVRSNLLNGLPVDN